MSDLTESIDNFSMIFDEIQVKLKQKESLLRSYQNLENPKIRSIFPENAPNPAENAIFCPISTKHKGLTRKDMILLKIASHVLTYLKIYMMWLLRNNILVHTE